MRKRGIKPKGKVDIKWSANFAYAIGLLVTDGNLSPDGRHISFTSKDKQQAENLKAILGLSNVIGKKNSGTSKDKKYYVLQWGDVRFYRFLQSIGIMPAKSKKLGKILIPEAFFFDFLRGCFDGDGYSYSYYDTRWKSSFMFYIGFVSASKVFLEWKRNMLKEHLGVVGHITSSKKSSCLQLKYAKREAGLVIQAMYDSPNCVCLERKRLKIKETLAMMGRPRAIR